MAYTCIILVLPVVKLTLAFELQEEVSSEQANCQVNTVSGPASLVAMKVTLSPGDAMTSLTGVTVEIPTGDTVR